MFELSGVNYEEVLEQGDSILVRVIASSSYRGFELSGLYCIIKFYNLLGLVFLSNSSGIFLFCFCPYFLFCFVLWWIEFQKSLN